MGAVVTRGPSAFAEPPMTTSLHRQSSTDAPGLDRALLWLNIDRPLSMKELRGCVVVLDFWTYCCINCMHVVPTLREIERRFADESVVVLGVHSGKFSAERNPDRIAEAIGRYGMSHPVVVDDDMHIWSAYGIRSWPTVVVVSADGKIAAVAPGEPELEMLEAFVRRELELAREAGTLARSKPPVGRAAPIEHEPLLYPGKASVVPDGKIAIADSGHHRVMLCEPGGRVVWVAGSGMRGFVDGAAEAATFDAPQGLCWHDGALFVADTRNHAIRRVDATTARVTTVAGTGQLGRSSPEVRHKATVTALRSPWDLCSVGDAIYVAMAGSHEIWRLWPRDGEIEVYAGSGVEALLDGSVGTSAWAQPSGLSERDGVLYVADSENSAIRAIDLGTDIARTLVGQGLFDFGDGDGDADAVLLQHCLGVDATDDGVLIADSYNGKIKVWQGSAEGTGTITTKLDGLNEPGSISVGLDGVWIIADTNAHRILAVREGVVAEVPIRGLRRAVRGAPCPTTSSRRPALSVSGWFTQLLSLPEGVGLTSGNARVWLDLATARGTALATGSPMTVSWEVSRRSDLLLLPRPHMSIEANGGRQQRLGLDVRVAALPEQNIEAELIATIDYVVCHEQDVARCVPNQLSVRVPVRLVQGGRGDIAFAVGLQGIEG